MRLSARRLALIAITTALVVAPAVAGAQAPPPPGGPASPAPPPPGGPGGGAPAAASDNRTSAQKNLDTPGDAKVEKRDAAGFTFSDKPVRRTGVPFRHVRTGPLATFPGFEQLPDGGSRLFVQLSQNVPVEERRGTGQITYVLKGAHVRVHNDTNALVTVHFNTPVSTARLLPSGNDTLLVVNLRATSTPTFKMQDNQDKTSTLMIDFAKGDFGGGDTVTQTPDTPERPVARKVGRTKKGQAPPPPPSPNTAPPPPGAAPAAPPPAGPTP
jgi:hypothetical protein